MAYTVISSSSGSSARVWLVLALLVALAALGTTVGAGATSNWLEYDVPGTSGTAIITIGPWKYCLLDECHWTEQSWDCDFLDPTKSLPNEICTLYDASRGLLAFSAAMGALTVLLVAGSLCCIDRRGANIAAAIFASLACIGALAAAGSYYMFAHKLDGIIDDLTNKHLHWEWLGALAGTQVLLVVAVSVPACIKRHVYMGYHEIPSSVNMG